MWCIYDRVRQRLVWLISDREECSRRLERYQRLDADRFIMRKCARA
jgi:hypothetical protein